MRSTCISTSKGTVREKFFSFKIYSIPNTLSLVRSFALHSFALAVLLKGAKELFALFFVKKQVIRTRKNKERIPNPPNDSQIHILKSWGYQRLK